MGLDEDHLTGERWGFQVRDLASTSPSVNEEGHPLCGPVPQVHKLASGQQL